MCYIFLHQIGSFFKSALCIQGTYSRDCMAVQITMQQCAALLLVSGIGTALFCMGTMLIFCDPAAASHSCRICRTIASKQQLLQLTALRQRCRAQQRNRKAAAGKGCSRSPQHRGSALVFGSREERPPSPGSRHTEQHHGRVALPASGQRFASSPALN